MNEIDELLQDISNRFNDLEKEKDNLQDEVDDLENEVADLKSDDNLHPILDYINELEKDYYFRGTHYKYALTVDKIVEDLIRLRKEV